MENHTRLAQRTPVEHPRVCDLAREDLLVAVGVLARGMRDNPVHVAAYGDNPDRRLRTHARLVGGLLAVMPRTALLGARHRGVLVGVAGAAPAGACRPTALVHGAAWVGPLPKSRAPSHVVLQ